MCSRIWSPSRVIETTGELAEMIGGPEGIVWRITPDYHPGWHHLWPWASRMCLCMVDVGETMRQAGIEAGPDDADPTDWRI